MKMPSAELLRFGGTASATASSGSISIITTSTRRKWKLAWEPSRCSSGTSRNSRHETARGSVSSSSSS